MNLQSPRVTPQQFAEVLRKARLAKSTVNPPSKIWKLDLQWALAVQLADKQFRIAAGETVVGAKLGLTSFAKQQAMNINRPVFGFLTNAMQVNSKIDRKLFNQPRIEPELVFKLSQDISGPIHITQASEYIEAIAVGFELIDSRYPKFQFTFEDVIADNISAAGFAVGTWHPYSGVDLSELHGYIEQDNVRLDTGSLRELLGNPFETLVALSRWVTSMGETLPAGSIVLAGSMTNAYPVIQGKKYRAGIEELCFLDLEVS